MVEGTSQGQEIGHWNFEASPLSRLPALTGHITESWCSDTEWQNVPSHFAIIMKNCNKDAGSSQPAFLLQNAQPWKAEA